jgi:hypothetical protein
LHTLHFAVQATFRPLVAIPSWRKLVSLGQRPVLFFRPDLEYLGYPDFVDPSCTGLDRAASLAAMILPNLEKRFYYETSFGREWEPFWTRLWHRADEALLRSDEIVIIGYSLPTADVDARKLLLETANKRASLSVCCGTQTASIEEQFRRAGFTNIEGMAVCTFDGWLSSRRP